MTGIAALSSLLVAAATVPLVIGFARRSGAVDAPNADVVTHTASTPLLGGLGFIAGSAVSTILLAGPTWSLRAVLGVGLLCAMGLYKDISRKDLDPKLQMVAQGACCVLIMLSVDGAVQAPPWLFALGVVAGIALINAVNFLDVSDGLCATVAITLFGGLFVAGAHGSSLCVAAALLGFLLWNRPRARVFMGDVGSFFIGTVLYCFLVDGLFAREWHPGALLMLAVPYGELAATTLVRLMRSRAITRGDASHVSLILLNAGMPPWTLIGLFSGVSLLFVGLALIIMG